MTYLGIQIEPQFGYTFEDIKTIVQTAEEKGFTHAWFSDHFMLNAEATDKISYECFTSMMAAASYTKTLRVGSLVFCNNYRYPPVLAKQIVGLDHYSKGRVEFGFGAGWKELEYNAYGIDYPSAGKRLEMMAEAIEVIRKLWTEEKPSFSGTHYSLKKAIAFPKPYQDPHPTIWVGTMYAKKKMLNLSVKHGDGINMAWSYSPKVFEEKMQKIDQLCEKYGKEPAEFKRSYGVWTRVYEDEDQKSQAIKKMAEQRNTTVEEIEKRLEGAFHGTPDEIAHWIKDYRKLGVSHFIFMFPGGQEIESIEKFSDLVIPNI